MKLTHIFICLLLLTTVMSCTNSKKQDIAGDSHSIVEHQNDSYSLIVVSCLMFNTSGCAEQYLDKLKREKGDLIKIPFFGFRIESQIYTIFVTSDIEHVRTNLYSNCVKKYKLDKKGCYP